MAQASEDIDIQLYEAAHELTEIGAGVGMWQRPWKVMEALGLREDLSHLVLSPLDDKPRKRYSLSLLTVKYSHCCKFLDIGFRLRKSDKEPGIYFHDLKMPS